jgi:PAS domain S-box-containing protein
MLEASGRQLLNTRTAFGAPLPVEAWPEMLQALRRKEPAVLDLFHAPSTGRLTVGVAIPARTASGELASLNANIDPVSLRDVLQRQKLPAGWIASVLDRTGAIVARTHDHDRFVNTKARAALIARISEVPEDAVESVTVNGVPVITAFSRSPSGWSVAIGIPRTELTAPLIRTSTWLVLGTVAVLLLTLGLAWWMARFLSDSVEALGSAVRATGHRASLRLPPPAFQEAHQLGQAFAHAHTALGDAYEALRHSEARMRAILDTATDAIVTADDEGRIVLFNPAAEALFRIDSEDALGRPVEALVPLSVRARHAQLRLGAADGVTRSKAGGRVIEGVRGDGTIFRAVASISVAQDGDRRLYTIILHEVLPEAAAPGVS